MERCGFSREAPTALSSSQSILRLCRRLLIRMAPGLALDVPRGLPSVARSLAAR